jgi:Ca-activated chloride channel family protein
MYPSDPLPDLFAGSQLVITGRFRDKGTATARLTGLIDGKTQTYTYSNLNFPDNAGGQPFVPRLWATRKIGALLNQIRLNGEKPELVDAVVRLSVRYGIITPYTSYLIQENDITAQGGGQGGQRDGAPRPIAIQPTAGAMMPVGGAAPSSGEKAVDAAQESNNMAGAVQAQPAPTAMALMPTGTAGGPGGPTDKTEPNKGTGRANEPIKQVNDRTFVLRNGTWIDTLYTSDQMKVTPVIFLSDEYFKLLDAHPEIKDYLAIGDHVIVVVGDIAYEVKPQ